MYRNHSNYSMTQMTDKKLHWGRKMKDDYGKGVNLTCQLGGSAARMNAKCAVGHGTTKKFMVRVMETV